MTSVPRPRLAVFDCDGTLLDSQHMIVAAMGAAFAGHGLAVPEAGAVRRVVGLSLIEAVAELAASLDGAFHIQIAETYKREFAGLRQRDEHDEPLYPGAREAIAALAGDGFVLGVATGKSRRGLRSALERHGLTDRFVTLQTADDGPSKPHPEMLRKAMAEAGAAAADTVMIGDTTFDMAMARNAGCGGIGVAWGYHPAEDLLAAGADVLVNSFSELPLAVAQLTEARQCA